MAEQPGATAGQALVRAADHFRAGEVHAGVDVLSAALREFTEAGDVRQAALAAARLGSAFEGLLGNRTAARAWFARATRMLQDEPACVEQGWVALAGLGCDVDDPEELLARAELALDLARRFGDIDLEAKALADGGLALVQAGRIDDGMGMLDEAIALWCGPALDRDSASLGVCSFFTACYYSAEFDRAGHWLDDLRRVGLVGGASATQAFLSGHCDAVLATALLELGRWTEAEGVLTGAIQEFEASLPIPSWHPAIALADLRIRQGRLGEAEALLLGKEDHLQALLPTAWLHLARGDVELARATATRGLRMVGSDVLRGVELLGLLTRAELAAGRLEEAQRMSQEMARRARNLSVRRLHALVGAARAQVLAHLGDLAAAINELESAHDALPEGLPVLRVSLALDLVGLHEAAGNRAAAAVEASRVSSTLARLDVALPARDLAVLARFAAGTAAATTARLVCDPDGWWVGSGGLQVRLPRTKGLRYLASLLARPGMERHALDLVDEVEGVDREGPTRHGLGDAGEVLDATARRTCRRRVETLREEIEQALAVGADDRAAALQEECDQVVGRLAAAFGLGGRARVEGSAAERARLNVTRSLRTAVARIRADFPEAGEVLDRRLRTGHYCAFDPAPDDTVRWVVQSGVNDPRPT